MAVGDRENQLDGMVLRQHDLLIRSGAFVELVSGHSRGEGDVCNMCGEQFYGTHVKRISADGDVEVCIVQGLLELLVEIDNAVDSVLEDELLSALIQPDVEA